MTRRITNQEEPEQKPVEAHPVGHTSRAEGETDLPSLTPSLVEFKKNLNTGNMGTVEEGPEQKPMESNPVEHSNLVRKPQELSSEDQQEDTSKTERKADLPSLTPSLVEFEKKLHP
ncbi:hypothetical protein GWI33_016666 [Rhynchophorus ferrugineus]|uniref:Uncharacterized protein n=1 Tax=Rhynchophorus ferrugineus TaxID=354439 RepID=A0A834I0Q4_RHYFE|nr:hypothetical protein GWI33_016666 [Rhynchophorus ferrugineus]